MSMASMNEYDRKIGSRLMEIRRYSEHVQDDSWHIIRLVDDLPMRPAWLTMALDEMMAAESDLREALTRIIEAQRRFSDLPIMVEFPSRQTAEQ